MKMTPNEIQVFLWGFVLESLMDINFFLTTTPLEADTVLRTADKRIRSYTEKVTGLSQPCQVRGNLPERLASESEDVILDIDTKNVDIE